MDNLLTTDQVAKLLGFHQNTVIRYIHNGRLPAVKVGKSYRIKQSRFKQLIPLQPIKAQLLCQFQDNGSVPREMIASLPIPNRS